MNDFKSRETSTLWYQMADLAAIACLTFLAFLRTPQLLAAGGLLLITIFHVLMTISWVKSGERDFLFILVGGKIHRTYLVVRLIVYTVLLSLYIESYRTHGVAVMILGAEFALMAFAIVCLFAGFAMISAPFLLLKHGLINLQAIRLRNHLHSRGFTNLTMQQSSIIYGSVGSAAFRLPPYEELAVLPRYRHEDPLSMIQFVEFLPPR